MQLPALAGRGVDLGRTLSTIAALKTARLQQRALETEAKTQETKNLLVSELLGGGPPPAPGAPPPAAPLSAPAQALERHRGGVLPLVGTAPALDDPTAVALPPSVAPADAGPLSAAPVSGRPASRGIDIHGSAFRALTALDPKFANNLASTVIALKGDKREDAEFKNGMVGSAAAYLLGLTPLQRQHAWPKVQQQLSQAGLPMPGRLPSEHELQMHMMRAASVTEIWAQQEREKTKAGELVKVLTADGPRYMRASDAVGKAPYEKAGAKKSAWNRTTKRPVFATDAEIDASGGNLVPPPRGLKFESDGQGGFTLVTDSMAAADGEVSKPTRRKLEGKAFDAQEGLARLSSIQASYKPQYQQLATRWAVLKSTVKEKLGFQLNPADKKLVMDFSAYKRDAIGNINLYIKEITGAQMSEAEADRLRLGAPDPGEGLLGGDAPSVFEGKMTSIVSSLRRANVRAIRALRDGVDWRTIDINDIPTIQQRGDQLLKGGGSKGSVARVLMKEGYMKGPSI
jgi:hypothetical protein